MNWYDWGSIQEKLITFGRAIQGVSPYKVIIEPDRRRCPTGWCDYSLRQIAVNPRLFPHLPAPEQYKAAKALLTHEAGHRRFTTPQKLAPLVHTVFNLLEDERTERLMSGHFAGLGHLLTFLAELFLKEARPLDPTSDDTGEILNYVLQLRWAKRVGEDLSLPLSDKNEALWERIEPLVQEAWQASNSEVVAGNAKKIVEILGLKTIPPWLEKLLEKLGRLEGERAEGDKAEKGRPTSGKATGKPPSEELDFDGVPLPYDHPAGSGKFTIEPGPYLHLVEQVQPLVRELVEELSFEPRGGGIEPQRRGGRLSIRQAMQDPRHPFLVEEEERKKQPSLTFRVLIDHSTSMNYRERMHYAKLGAMVLHLVGVKLAIPHVIAVTPNDVRIADLESGERGLALLAGLVGKTFWERIEVTIARHGEELLARREDARLILVIHDGFPDKFEEAQKVCRVLRGKVEVIGIGLDFDEGMASALKELFGQDRLILCATPQELPYKLGNLLRAIYGV